MTNDHTVDDYNDLLNNAIKLGKSTTDVGIATLETLDQQEGKYFTPCNFEVSKMSSFISFLVLLQNLYLRQKTISRLTNMFLQKQ